ncbi:telomere repeats-binding bouquet formation protein 2-like [Diadema antillarum]|uniref:telomere repeats-binding bouquet formation protein 2-like n=1 Tax=Diadema antillarum TaxID=105358 RepID=UPI003A8BF594
MTSDVEQVFQHLKAWFSSSVSQDKKISWIKHGGREVSTIKDANFVFTANANCHDTLRIFESEDFLLGFLSIFHASYIDACLEMQTAHEVAAAKFIVLPPDMSADIQRLAFVDSTTQSVSSGLPICKDQTRTTDNAVQGCQQGKRSATDKDHSCSHSEAFVGGLEVRQSDINFTIGDLDSIPHVNSLPKCKGEICDFIPGVNGFSVSLKA